MGTRQAKEVVSFPEERPHVELVDGRLLVHEMELAGAIVEVATEHVKHGANRAELEELVRDAVTIGGTALLHGQVRATVESVASKIDELMRSTTDVTEQLPETMQLKLNEHLVKLGEALAKYFDESSTSSVQERIAKLVKGATREQAQELTKDLFAETGPIGTMNGEVMRQLKLVNSSNQDVVGRVSDVVGKVSELASRVEAKLKLDAAHDKSSVKGLPFQGRVGMELEALHGRLQDDVRDVGAEYGDLPHSKKGDLVVTVNPKETGGREVRIVVETKTGPLSKPGSQRELDEAMENRGAVAGILVFDGVADARLDGRHYCAYPDGRFVVVYEEDGDALPLEVACYQARALAIASLRPEGAIDAGWLLGRCDELSALIEKAREIKTGIGQVQRGVDLVDRTYTNLRQETMQVLDEMRVRLNHRDG